MSIQFTIQVGRHVATGELLTDAAPRLCRAFLQCLPLDSFAVHAKFAGHELIVMLPFFHEQENEALAVAPGDIGYYPARQTLCLFYGEVLPFGPVSSFARIVAGLDAMRAAGAEALQAGPLPTRIAPLGPDPAGGPGTSSAGEPARPDGAAGQPFDGPLALIARFLDRVWASEPADVARLRLVERPPTGNGACVLYANFDLFWLGENLLVCRRNLLDGTWTLEQTRVTTAALARQAANRLEKWGFSETVGLLRTAADALDAPAGAAATPAALVAFLEALLVAVNRVQSWVDAAIPWATLDQTMRLHAPPAIGSASR